MTDIAGLVERLEAARAKFRQAIDSEWMPDPAEINDLLLVGLLLTKEAAERLKALEQKATAP